jgi:hypothetical protein
LFEFFYQVGYQFLKTLNNLRTDLDFKCWQNCLYESLDIFVNIWNPFNLLLLPHYLWTSK